MDRNAILEEIYSLPSTCKDDTSSSALFVKYKDCIDGWFSNRLCAAWETEDFKKLVKYEQFSGCPVEEWENIRKMFNWLWNLKNKPKQNHVLDSDKLIPTPYLVKTYVNYYCLEDKHTYPDLKTPHRSKFESYQENFETIKYLMNLLRDNNDKDAVAIKVCVVKDLYGVRLDSIAPIVKAISGIGNFSEMVKSNEISDQKYLVKQITNIHGADKNYSFATKYCHVHNPDYAIYDKYAAGTVIYLHLRYVLKDRAEYGVDNYIEGIIPPCKKEFNDLKLGDLKESLLDYSNYKTAIDNIQKVYGLKPESDDKPFSYDEIDKYLWGFGRDFDITLFTVRAVLKDNGIM